MKHNWQIIFIIIILLGTNSCVNIVIEKDNKLPIAISSFFTNDSIFKVKISSMINIGESDFKTVGVEEMKLINQTTSDIFILTPENQTSDIYSNNKINIEKGDILTLEITSGDSNTKIFATDSIPQKEPLFSISNFGFEITKESSHYSVKRKASILLEPQLNENEISYYELEVYLKIDNGYSSSDVFNKSGWLKTTTNLITSEDYYPTSTTIDKSYPATLLFKVEGDTTNILIDFIYSVGFEAGRKGTKSYAHDLKVNLKSINKAYYKYLAAFYLQSSTISGDIIYGASQPVFIKGNVENAYGIFAGYNCSSKIIHLDEYIFHRE
ncbi:MAG TPA: DUF4249 family protein [Prolixibacteraceae bacterium]|nr:DUF4249 family protein [Prolixibacteraceae bacterium]